MSVDKFEIAKSLVRKVKSENLGDYIATMDIVDWKGNKTDLVAEVTVVIRKRGSTGLIKLGETRQDAAPMSLFGSSACPCCGR